MNNPLVFSLCSGLFFGIWPLLSRVAGMSSIWVAVTYAVGTLAAILIGMLFQYGNTPSTFALAQGVIAGALNGIGILSYGKLVSTPEWDLSIYGPMVNGFMLIVLAVGAVIIFSEAVSIGKIGGVVAILFGMYMLR